MPQETRIEVKVRELRTGDKFQTVFPSSANWYVVEDKIVKTKWAEVKDTTGRTHRILADDQVDVLRVVPTEEEKVAEERRWQERTLGRNLVDAFHGVDVAVAKLTETHAKGYRTGWTELDRIAEAQADLEIWGQVAAILAQGEGTHIVEAVEQVVKAETKRLVNNEWRGSSTSQMSNTCEAIRRAAASKFVTYGRWAV